MASPPRFDENFKLALSALKSIQDISDMRLKQTNKIQHSFKVNKSSSSLNLSQSAIGKSGEKGKQPVLALKTVKSGGLRKVIEKEGEEDKIFERKTLPNLKETSTLDHIEAPPVQLFKIRKKGEKVLPLLDQRRLSLATMSSPLQKDCLREPQEKMIKPKNMKPHSLQTSSQFFPKSIEVSDPLPSKASSPPPFQNLSRSSLLPLTKTGSRGPLPRDTPLNSRQSDRSVGTTKSRSKVHDNKTVEEDIKDIRKVFKNFRVTSLKDFKAHPLEKYDPFSNQPADSPSQLAFSPEANLDHLIQQNPEAESRWLGLDGTVCWKDCWVIEYDPLQREFKIRWKDTLQRKESVRRLNLVFRGEDRLFLEANREKALELRARHLLKAALRETALTQQSVPPCKIFFPCESLERVFMK